MRKNSVCCAHQAVLANGTSEAETNLKLGDQRQDLSRYVLLFPWFITSIFQVKLQRQKCRWKCNKADYLNDLDKRPAFQMKWKMMSGKRGLFYMVPYMTRCNEASNQSWAGIVNVTWIRKNGLSLTPPVRQGGYKSTSYGLIADVKLRIKLGWHWMEDEYEKTVNMLSVWIFTVDLTVPRWPSWLSEDPCHSLRWSLFCAGIFTARHRQAAAQPASALSEAIERWL